MLGRMRVGTVELRTVVPAEVAREFLAIYRDAFSSIERQSPARQALTEDEFLAAMADQSVLKLVGCDHQGEVCAMAIMATDLSVVPWISVPYFAARFPEHHSRSAIYYIHAAFVRPRSQGGPWARLLFEELAAMMSEDRAVAAFDCSSHTVETTRLPDMFARVSSRVDVLDPLELDRQHYYGYVFGGVS